MLSNEETLQIIQENEQLREQQTVFREILVKLTTENTSLREDNLELVAQNAAYLQRLQQRQTKEENRSTENTGRSSTVVIEELHATIEELERRVMVLVHEKLSMHTLIEALEHELALLSSHTQNCHDENRCTNSMEETIQQEECLERVRQQQQQQLLLDHEAASRRRLSINENSTISLGEFDIRKELEEHLDQRTTSVRPHTDYVSKSSSYMLPVLFDYNNCHPDNDHGTRMPYNGGKSEGEIGTKYRTNENECTEKQRRSLWRGRRGTSDIVRPGGRGLRYRKNAATTKMMMDDDDDVIEHFNSRRESDGPIVVDSSTSPSRTSTTQSGKRNNKENARNLVTDAPNLNLVL